MKDILRQEDVRLVEDKLKQFEAATGCELLLVHAKTCDAYPGATWRFGILGGVALAFAFSLYFDFHHNSLWPLITLAFILLMSFIGRYDWAKKLALSDVEVDRECFEKSVEYFHTLGTSKVSHKVTAMIMVSVLERKIMVLVDEKLKSEITQPELDELVDIMKKHFKAGNIGLGFVQSIESFQEKILKDFGGRVSEAQPSELKDIVHFV